MRKLRKSKSFKLSLILILVVSMALPVVASAGSRGSQLYSDVNPGHWFYNDVEILSKKGAIDGYPDDKFRPFNKITHAETIKVISTMYDSDVENRDMEIRINSLNTTKNKPNHWATKYLQAAYNNKIFTLNEMGLAYDEPATRHDTALYMLNYINAKTKEDKVEPLIFNDGPLSDSYFLDAHGPGLNFLFEAGIVLGTPDEENGVSFNGREPITRAEFTAMMNRTILFV